MEVLKSSALSGSATLIIFNQYMKTEVRKGVQKSEMSILSCLRDVNFFAHEIFWSHWLQMVLPASKYSDIGGSRGSPDLGLAAAGNWWWREAEQTQTETAFTVMLQGVSSCRFLVSSSRTSAGRTGGLGLFALLCSSQSIQVHCKESIRWLNVMFCFLWHLHLNVDSLSLLSFFL